MCKFIVIHLSLCSILFVLTDCTSSYDQRQTGSLNVQVGLKNIQLIALLKGGKEEYVDYDYAYDYSEMTIKPQGGTTPKPSNNTNTQTQTNATTSSLIEHPNNLSIPQQTSTVSIAQRLNATEDSINTTPTVDSAETIINATVRNEEIIINHNANMENSNYSTNTTTAKDTADVPTTISPDSPNMSTIQTASASNCKRGFVQNHQGKCEYKVHGTTNALRRIVKLAQRIKIGRGYTGT